MQTMPMASPADDYATPPKQTSRGKRKIGETNRTKSR